MHEREKEREHRLPPDEKDPPKHQKHQPGSEVEVDITTSAPTRPPGGPPA